MAIILWFWYKINALQACTYCKTFSCASCIMVCLWCLNQITVYSLFKEKKLFFFFFYCSGGYLWTSFYKAAFCNWEDWHSPSFCSPDSCRWVLLYVLELFLCVCLFEIVYWQFSSFFPPIHLKQGYSLISLQNTWLKVWWPFWLKEFTALRHFIILIVYKWKCFSCIKIL